MQQAESNNCGICVKEVIVYNNSFQGWGFCHENCNLESFDQIVSKKLQKVEVTILGAKSCQLLANVEKDNFGRKQIFDATKELCAGFIQTPNTTNVFYSKKKDKKGNERFQSLLSF